MSKTEIRVRPARRGYEVCTFHINDEGRERLGRAQPFDDLELAQDAAEKRRVWWERAKGVGTVRVVHDYMLGGEG